MEFDASKDKHVLFLAEHSDFEVKPTTLEACLAFLCKELVAGVEKCSGLLMDTPGVLGDSLVKEWFLFSFNFMFSYCMNQIMRI